ncbi:hypothetical protein XA68_12070 [Ophiocordyceps unilateralis]|uniref:Uncharacterized protein n=1 Tax=Ophiocordyceps unilateralis TaxID=268505 RepID=A0A2A9PEK3_OPHUN|nr:hypothetical protein XA68_12070 [Ophiocordyceps unilateralis]
MDPKASTASGVPLQAATPERMNQRLEPLTPGRDGSVHDKISQFNSLSIAMQSKQLERRTADAALKRALVGREEAEAEMRRLKEETMQLQKAVSDGHERERKVGERLETVMENYGRAKETHAHTQALWEKEIRRARKENFKSQSVIVKLQEELKSTRSTTKALEERLAREREQMLAREEAAFAARYQLVGVQEQLDEALARIKRTEQERDAFKMAAQNEEVARIAAEGKIPLPTVEAPDDEFASPRKKKKKQRRTFSYASVERGEGGGEGGGGEVEGEAGCSEVAEVEREELAVKAAWERLRADRALEMVEFLEVECRLRCCACVRERREKEEESVVVMVVARDEGGGDEVGDGGEGRRRRSELASDDEARQSATTSAEGRQQETASDESRLQVPVASDPVQQVPSTTTTTTTTTTTAAAPDKAQSTKKPPPCSRRSTIFCPREGIFRTVSEEEAEALSAAAHDQAEASGRVVVQPHQGHDHDHHHHHQDPRIFARTPSVEPPAFAMQRPSLESLLDAPPGPSHESHTAPLPSMIRCVNKNNKDNRPHTSATSYAITTTVPLRDDDDDRRRPRPSSSLASGLRTPCSAAVVVAATTTTTFDRANPALTPTMTREQALATIRERRGRVRSAAAAAAAAAATTTATPRERFKGADRRLMSAPTPTSVATRAPS